MAIEPSREDAWGLVPAIPDPPPSDAEIGVTTDGEDWGTPAPRTTPGVVTIIGLTGFAGLAKARYLIIKRGWHRRRL